MAGRELLPLRPRPLRPRRPRLLRGYPRRPRPAGIQPREENRRRRRQGRPEGSRGSRSRPRAGTGRPAQPRSRDQHRHHQPDARQAGAPRARRPPGTRSRPGSSEGHPGQDPALPAQSRAGAAGHRDQAAHPRHRMAAFNTETILARALHGHYARAEDEAYALIREALTASGDITPRDGTCTSAWTRSPHPAAPAHSPRSASSSTPPQPATPARGSPCTTRSKNTTALHKRSLYVRSPGHPARRASSRGNAGRRCLVRSGTRGPQPNPARRKCSWPPLTRMP